MHLLDQVGGASCRGWCHTSLCAKLLTSWTPTQVKKAFERLERPLPVSSQARLVAEQDGDGPEDEVEQAIMLVTPETRRQIMISKTSLERSVASKSL